MAYHTSIYLFVFLPLALLSYQLTPKRKRWITLLAFSYIFFWMISGRLVFWLIGISLFTHYTGVWLTWMKFKCKKETAVLTRQESKVTHQEYKKKEKMILIFGILCLLSVLMSLKYYNFFAENVNNILNISGIDFNFEIKTLLVPVGLSFYTLQAIGYMADVYWEKTDVYWHPGKTLLFLSFFPQIMEGPICAYDQTAENLWRGNPIRSENLLTGSRRILWGLFKKMIIADRLNLLVKGIFDSGGQYHGIMIIIGAVAYTIQLYMEFSGCMDMIIGSGKMFGVTLPENFRQPFFSKNAAEFWRRWHITLGVWFRTYVFYPVSVSRFVKKWNKFGKAHLSKYITKLGISAAALFPVWLGNGLWHGARWNYIFYGMYYFVILLTGIAVEPVREKVLKKLHLDPNALWFRGTQIIKTWMIIFTGEMFFRANGLRAGIEMFRNIFNGSGIDSLQSGTLLSFGLDMADYCVIMAACAVVMLIDILKEKKIVKDNTIQNMILPIRWGLYYSLIFAVLVFGAYGIGYQQVDMIYAGF